MFKSIESLKFASVLLITALLVHRTSIDYVWVRMARIQMDYNLKKEVAKNYLWSVFPRRNPFFLSTINASYMESSTKLLIRETP